METWGGSFPVDTTVCTLWTQNCSRPKPSSSVPDHTPPAMSNCVRNGEELAKPPQHVAVIDIAMNPSILSHRVYTGPQIVSHHSISGSLHRNARFPPWPSITK